jgi:hypothetical protein
MTSTARGASRNVNTEECKIGTGWSRVQITANTLTIGADQATEEIALDALAYQAHPQPYCSPWPSVADNHHQQYRAYLMINDIDDNSQFFFLFHATSSTSFSSGSTGIPQCSIASLMCDIKKDFWFDWYSPMFHSIINV